MTKFTRALISVSVIAMMPVIAGAAGTYYNGNLYQSPQRYGSNAGGYYNNYGAGRVYGQNQSMTVRNTTTRVTKKSSKKQTTNNAKRGFQLNAYLSHEKADWDFEMKNAKSELRYDGIAWNVLSGEAAYYFGSSVPMQVKVGGRYGVQFGEISMIDDDISNGGYGSADMYGGTVSGYAMSVGTSKDGKQYGFNAAFGLTDFFKMGRVKVTPSIGYRYFKHELKTSNNSGLTMDVFNDYCETFGEETQCYPFVGLVPFYDASGNVIYVTDSEGNTVPAHLIISGGEYNWNEILSLIPSNTVGVNIDLGDTYYYHQTGTSHKYETIWQGPYVALDMEYAINDYNLVTAGVAFGLPVYESKGDQPYRIDWAHPTSVKDKGDFGDAYHLGLNAMWSTAVSDTVMLSLGLTYDYYKVSDADASTYYNAAYYQPILNELNDIVAHYNSLDSASLTELQKAEKLYYEQYQQELEGVKSNGWSDTAKGEIKSIYSSMGIRAGVSIKF